MSGPISFAQVKSFVDELAKLVSEWEVSRDPALVVQWRGGTRRAVNLEIQELANALFEAVNTDEFENSHHCRALVLAIDDFDDAFCGWAEDCQRRPEVTDPQGGARVWDAYNAMLALCKPKSYPLPEPIGALVAQKVSHQQIAKIYGWKTENGQPDQIKVQEEITTPGTHFKPSEWVHPAMARAVAEVEHRWAGRKVKAEGRPMLAGSQPAPPKPVREAPETLDELIMNGVSVAQIAKMKRVSETTVRERAAEIGVPLDGGVLAAAAAMRRQLPPTEDEQLIAERAEAMRFLGAKDYGELGNDLDARVKALGADKWQPRDIVKILAPAFPGLQYQKVTRILQQAELATAK